MTSESGAALERAIETSVEEAIFHDAVQRHLPSYDDGTMDVTGVLATPELRTEQAASRPLPDPRRPAPAPDRPRHLHAVPGRPAPGRRPPVLLFVGTLLAGAVLTVLVAINVLVGQTGVSESSLQKSIDAKQQQADLLGVDVLRLSAPARVHQRALQLGMVPAGEVQYLAPATISANGPQSAAPSIGRGGH